MCVVYCRKWHQNIALPQNTILLEVTTKHASSKYNSAYKINYCFNFKIYQPSYAFLIHDFHPPLICLIDFLRQNESGPPAQAKEIPLQNF